MLCTLQDVTLTYHPQNAKQPKKKKTNITSKYTQAELVQYSRESFIGTSRDMDTAIQLYRVRKGDYTGSKHEMQSLVYNEELEDSVYSDDDDDNDPMPSTSPGSRTLVPTLCSRCSGASS